MVDKLRALVIVKNIKPVQNMGMFSYSVDEFVWDYATPDKGSVLHVDDSKYDFIFHEDGGRWCDYDTKLPVIYYSIDSTLSYEHHFLPRLIQARKADLVLVDHDSLDRFSGCKKVMRFGYCANDKLFYKQGSLIDVNFHCGSSPERKILREQLNNLCQDYGYSYVSGVVDIDTYAQRMNNSKLVINWPRNKHNRSHRIVDGIVSGACVITGAHPLVDNLLPNIHMEIADSLEELLELVKVMLSGGLYKLTTSNTEPIRHQYTWQYRAKELRELLQCEFSL
jgi:hypothetical protein